MKTEMRRVGTIRPYEKNPRRNAAAVDAVARSIEEFGFRQPIVIDKAGVVIVGHTRLLAAQKLGLEEVPVHVANLTPAQARAYRIADNKTNELATWDWMALSAEIAALAETKIDLTDLGFSDAELKNLMEMCDVPGVISSDLLNVNPGMRMNREGGAEVVAIGRFIGAAPRQMVQEIEAKLQAIAGSDVAAKLVCSILKDKL